MTVPALMSNTNGEEYRSKLKKAISGVNQALVLHYALEGLTAQDYSTPEDLINNVFKKRMNVIEIDDNTFPKGYNLNAGDCYELSAKNTFITQDGILFCITDLNWNNGSSYSGSDETKRPCNSFNTVPCSYYVGSPNLTIDVNAFKTPNKSTEYSSSPSDRYFAQIYNTKVEPLGAATDIINGSENVNTGELPGAPPWAM